MDPITDHNGELNHLQRFADQHPDTATVATSGCLGRCEHANVIVVRPSPDGRRRGGRPVWLARVDAVARSTLIDWVTAGGPGVAATPIHLQLHQIEPARPGSTELVLASQAAPG